MGPKIYHFFQFLAEFGRIWGPRASPGAGGRPTVRGTSGTTDSQFKQIQLETFLTYHTRVFNTWFLGRVDFGGSGRGRETPSRSWGANVGRVFQAAGAAQPPKSTTCSPEALLRNLKVSNWIFVNWESVVPEVPCTVGLPLAPGKAPGPQIRSKTSSYRPFTPPPPPSVNRRQ